MAWGQVHANHLAPSNPETLTVLLLARDEVIDRTAAAVHKGVSTLFGK